MTLYYPSGLYGPVCDIQQSSTEVETVVNEVILQEPNINRNLLSTTTTEEETSTPIQRLIPKICRTVTVNNLYGGPFGPICDYGLGSPGSSNVVSAFQICEVDFPVENNLYNPLTGLPDELPLDIPGLLCESTTVDIPTPNGTKTITYYSKCRPQIGSYGGPSAEEYGLKIISKKPQYVYTHTMVCGSTDYYSSPAEYSNEVPNGITLVNIFAFGAGGGAGGADKALGLTGSGNNSGGSGSFMYVTVTLDPSKRNRIEMVVGGGGNPGTGWNNRPEEILGGFNRGGKGGYPGPKGLSGSGGSGGGSTDIFLNGRLIMSVAGGGGGGGNGCNFFKGPSNTSPYGNWNNYSYNNNPLTSSSALIRSRFSPLMAVPVYEPTLKHSLWSDWFKQYVVWFDAEQNTLPGTQLENRVNLNFDVSGTYTFEFQGDNQLAIYIAPWYDPGEGAYVTDNLYNGSVSAIRNRTKDNQPIPVDSDGNLLPPTTLNADITGASNWTKVGFTTSFSIETPNPTIATYTITTPGRYVIRTILENAFGDSSKEDWLVDPGGMGIVIKKPDGSVLWTTRSAFGNNGANRIDDGDGPGAGGGGGNNGLGGLTAIGMGLTGGSCGDADSTAQGGSAGWSYILDHPAVSVNFFGQAPAGFISGWNTPTPSDPTVRRASGGFGAGKPNKLSIIFDGTPYSLYNSNGSFNTVVIPGMGTGVWQDHMNQKTFQYNYFWGAVKDGSPDTIIPSLIDDGIYGQIALGSYQGAYNSAAAQRSALYKARGLELSLEWTPIKTGANTWNTQIKLIGIPSWGQGTGFALNDLLSGVMPSSKSQGTQPWWDILYPNGWHVLEFYDDVSKTNKPAVYPNTSINFQIRVDDVSSEDNYTASSGQPGFARTQYYSADYQFIDDLTD